MDTKFSAKDQFDKSVFDYFQMMYQYLHNMDDRFNQFKENQSNEKDFEKMRGRMADVEKKIDLIKLAFSNELGDIKGSFKTKYETIDNNFKLVSSIIEELQKMKLQSVGTNQGAVAIKRDEFLSKVDYEVVADLKRKVFKLEAVVADYLKMFIEPEALSRAQKIVKPYVLINEKFECLMFLIKNYKLLNPQLIVDSLQNFKNLLVKHNFK